MARPPRVPNWLGWEQATIYFITMCIRPRCRALDNLRAWETCLEVFKRLNQWTILAAVAMPDHLHVLAAPVDRDASVSAFSKWFKRWFNESYDCRLSVSEGTAQSARSWHWQEGCFDRLLRSDESLSDKWLYLQQNPVRAGLVCDTEDWPYQFAFNSENGKL